MDNEKYKHSIINITDNEKTKISNCDITCKLVLKNLKNSVELRNVGELNCNIESSNCFINFGVIPSNNTITNNTKYNLNSIKIIYNPDIKIDSYTKLINTNLFFYLTFKNNYNNDNLYIFIPIINNDSSDNFEFNKFLNNTNIKLSDLYNTVFPKKHSFYFFKKSENNITDNIIIFDNKVSIKTDEYFKIKDILGTTIPFTPDSTIDISNVYYSNKLNCLYENIEISKEQLTSSTIEYNTNVEPKIETANFDTSNPINSDDININWKRGLITILIFLYFSPPFFSRITKLISDRTYSQLINIVAFIIFIILIIFWSIGSFSDNNSDNFFLTRFFGSSNMSDFNWFYVIQWSFLFMYSLSIIIKSFGNFYRSSWVRLLLIIVILIFIIVGLTKFTGSITKTESGWLYLIYIVVYIIITFLLVIKGKILNKSVMGLVFLYSFCAIIYLITDPFNLFKNFLGENNFYNSENWFYKMLRYLIIIFITVVLTSEFNLRQTMKIPKFDNKINLLGTTFILILLIIAIIINIYKLTEKTYVKIIEFKTNPTNTEMQEYKNIFENDIYKNNIDKVIELKENGKYQLFIYYYKDDNKLIIKTIDEILVKNKNVDKNNFTIKNKEYTTLDKVYNSSFLIFIKIIIICLTISSFFIQNYVYDLILFFILIVFLLYSIFGLYYIQEHNVTLILSVIVTIIYFLIYITKFILTKNLGSKYKIYSNINLYLILFLITVVFVLSSLRINGFISGNILIYGIICLIIVFSSIFYFISIRDISEEKGNNALVTTNIQNVNLQKLVNIQRNLNKKTEDKRKQQLSYSTKAKSTSNTSSKMNVSHNNSSITRTTNANTSNARNASTSNATNTSNTRTSNTRTSNTKSNNKKDSSFSFLSDTNRDDKLLDYILRDLEALNGPDKDKLAIIKGKINKLNSKDKDYKNHAKSLIKEQYGKYSKYLFP